MKRKARPLSVSEHEYMIEQLSRPKQLDEYWLLWGLLFETGMRPIELLNLKKQDISKVEKSWQVTIDSAKGSQKRVCFISSLLGELFTRYTSSLAPSEPLFHCVFGKVTSRTARNKLDQAWCEFRIGTPAMGADLQLYSFRHNYGTQVYKHYRDVLLVRKLMGHYHLSSTQHYVEQISLEEESLDSTKLFRRAQ